MNRSNFRLILLLVLFGVLVLCLGVWLRSVNQKNLSTREKLSAKRGETTESKAVASPPAERLQIIDQAYHSLNQSNDPGTSRKLLEKLKQTLASDKSQAGGIIRTFLDTHKDAPTHGGFSVGGNGLLKDAPTLRVFLLDLLGEIDPKVAAEYARTILARKDSADEWAVALRNLAVGDTTPSGRAFLLDKTRELLSESAWQQNPSAGYLEAFDVAVFLGGTNLLSPLAELIRKQDNPAVAHASYLAMDRLTIRDPVGTLTALGAAPELMEGREVTRANYFARADIRDPQQRQLIETYLLNPRLSPAELDTFAGLFPNANFMVSQNLLTPNTTLDRATLVSRDAESLKLVEQWLVDQRFSQQTPALQKIKSRLEVFVQQAQRGP